MSRKIDIYSHFSFPRFLNYLEEKSGNSHEFGKLFANTKSLIDVDERLKLMDKLDVEKNVLVPLPEIGMTPEIENNTTLTTEAAHICNNEMANMISRHSDRLIGVGILPTSNSDTMISALENSVYKLKLAGGVFGVGPNLKPPDHPDFELLYAKAAELDVPIWIHPVRSSTFPEYEGEKTGSKFQFFQAFSWLFDSTLAMHRIVFSGVFERHPTLKIIIHHHGAIIPYFAGRVDIGIQFFKKNAKCKYDTKTKAPYTEQYKKFYIDTATQFYNPDALQIAVNFFGADHTLFGSDVPMDANDGLDMGENADKSIMALHIDDQQRKQIYFGNAERILNIS